MKRKTLFLLFLTSSILCSGQQFLSQIYIEPRINLSVATLIKARSPFGYGTYNQEALSSISYSILIKYRISANLSLNTGYSREKKGGTGSYNFFESDGITTVDKFTEVSVKNEYHTFPLFARFHSKPNSFSYFGDFGFYISALQKSDIKIYIQESVVVNGNTISEKDESFRNTETQFTNGLDYGVMIGGGISYILKDRMMLQFNPQISLGLMKLDRYNSNDRDTVVGNNGPVVVEKDYFTLSSKSKNLLFSINVGLSYKIRD